MPDEPDSPAEGGARTSGSDLLEAYRQMLASLFIATLAVLLTLTIASIGVYLFAGPSGGAPERDLPVLVAVALAGTLGALFSALMRLYNVRELPQALLHPELRRLRNKYLLMYSLVPIVMGFVASVVVYLAMLSGIVSGAAFPAFSCNLDSGDCDSFRGLFDYGPKAAQDYAKVIVIGFASGFSERLVGNVLGNLERA